MQVKWPADDVLWNSQRNVMAVRKLSSMLLTYAWPVKSVFLTQLWTSYVKLQNKINLPFAHDLYWIGYVLFNSLNWIFSATYSCQYLHGKGRYSLHPFQFATCSITDENALVIHGFYLLFHTCRIYWIYSTFDCFVWHLFKHQWFSIMTNGMSFNVVSKISYSK